MFAFFGRSDVTDHHAEVALQTVRLVERMERDFGSIVRLDRMCVGITDPFTGLATMVHSRHPIGRPEAYLAAELFVPDFNKFDWLARQPEPVGVLSGATGGDPELSYRYRTMLKPSGIEHELRGALVADGSCWGYAALFREAGRPDFTAGEVQAIGSAIPRLAAELRASLLAESTMDGHSLEPGVAIVGLDGSLEAANSRAEEIFDQISTLHPVGELGLPVPISVIASGLRESDPSDTRRVLLAGPNGEWLVLTGCRVTGRDDASRVVVRIEPAAPMLLAPLRLRRFGLTEREIKVALCVLKGMPNAEIAEDLAISRYTVQDHLKSVFAKTDVHSRHELVRAMLPRGGRGELV